MPPLKDVCFMIILCEKFGEEVITIDSHSFKNNHRELAMERAEELGETLNPPQDLQLIISALSLGGTVSPVTLLPVRMHNAFLVIPHCMMEVKPKRVKLAAGGPHVSSKVGE